MKRYYAIIGDNGSILDVFRGKEELEKNGYSIGESSHGEIMGDYYEYGWRVVCGLDNILREAPLYSRDEIREMV